MPLSIDFTNTQERLLLQRAVEDGDQEAVGEIYKKHKPFLDNYLAKLEHQDGYAEDLTQDVFLAISQRQGNYAGDTDVRGYLCGIAKNVALGSNRREARQGIAFTDCLLEEILPIHHDDPSQYLDLEEIRAAIEQAIAALPEKSRQAIELVYLDGLKPHQAARKLGCPQVVFNNRLARGLWLLRGKLSGFSKKSWVVSLVFIII